MPDRQPRETHGSGGVVHIWNRLWHLVLAKFFGNFNDNAFKTVVTLVAIGDGTDRNRAFAVAAIVSAMFMVPFIALPSVAGWLADRFPRRQVLLWMKIAELAIMSVGAVALIMQPTWGVGPLFAAMVAMAVQSSFFSPSFRGLMPEIFEEKDLSQANGLAELLGYLGIILGLGAGGAMTTLLPAASWQLGAPFVILGIVGLGIAMCIPRSAAPVAPEPFRLGAMIVNYVSDFRYIRLTPAIFYCVMGNALFGAIGFLLTNSLFNFGKYEAFGDAWGLARGLGLTLQTPADLAAAAGASIHLTDMGISSLQLAAAIGIGIGCVVAGVVSGDKVEFGLVPFGAIGMAVCCGALLVFEQFHWILLSLFMLGMAGGCFTLPLSVYIQEAAPAAVRGKTLAAANAVSFWAMFLTSVLLIGLTGGIESQPPAAASLVAPASASASAPATTVGEPAFHVTVVPGATPEAPVDASLTGSVTVTSAAPDTTLTPASLGGATVAPDVWTTIRSYFLTLDSRNLYLGLLIVLVLLTVYLAWLLPEFVIRMSILVLTRLVYSLRILHKDRLPRSGPVLLIANHVSLVDGLLISAATPRPVYFLATEAIERRLLLRPFVRWARIIPLPAGGNPKALARGLELARQKLREGHIVCVFPEGRVTGNGMMGEFKRGFLQLLPDEPDAPAVPIVPVHLGLLWGSIFSARYGEVKVRKPRNLPYPVTITFGHALTRDVTPMKARQAVAELDAESEIELAPGEMTITQRFVAMCRRRPFAKLWVDTSGARLSNLQMLIRAYVIAAVLRREDPDARHVGFIVPASTGGAILAFGALLADKVPVFLNFTASSDAVDYAIRECQIRKIYTSRLFAEKAKLNLPAGTLFLDDLRPTIGAGIKLRAVLCAVFLPSRLAARWIFPRYGRDMSAVATVLFSSGSTGKPKGVPLTHHNLTGNLNGVARVLGMEPTFVILGSLPFFHSFGFLATLCLPMAWGLTVVYHPNPMDAQVIGETIEKEKVTMLLATPTFLQAYTRKCTREQMQGLKLVITGAEKLRPNIAEKFAEKFGVVPIEGYGTTELSPVVSVNMPRTLAEIGRAIGRPGSVGLPLPGVAVRIVNPTTWEPLDVDQEGLLLVRGPNVMLGYLNDPERTAEVLRDGWYNTGDMAKVDRDGYIFITGRLSRFSKIGGEMIPHLALEDHINEILEAHSDTLAVVSAVDDEDRGERLIILHRPEITKTPQEIIAALRALGLPNLWIPKARDFHPVPNFPVLGSGKLDLAAVKSQALALSGGGEDKGGEA